jgi:hypothetical protein
MRPLEQTDLSIAAMRCFVKWNWILDVPTIAPLPATPLLKSPHHQTFDDLEAALSGGLFRFKQACTSAHGPSRHVAPRLPTVVFGAKRTLGGRPVKRYTRWRRVKPVGPLANTEKVRSSVGLGIDQHARIEQAMRIQGRLGRPECSGKQLWALAIVPRPMVASDRMMVSDRATVLDHGI